MKEIALIFVTGCGVLMSPTGPPTRAPILAHMEKGGCLGECPIYDLNFYADGTIEYVGKQNVEVKGRRWVRIDPELLRGALRFDFGKADYAHLPEVGQIECTDQQTVTFEYGGKRVFHDYGDSHAPEAMHFLETDLDYLAHVEPLVGDRYIMAEPQGSYCYDTKTIYLAP